MDFLSKSAPSRLVYYLGMFFDRYLLLKWPINLEIKCTLFDLFGKSFSKEDRKVILMEKPIIRDICKKVIFYFAFLTNLLKNKKVAILKLSPIDLK
jgi:hypothetical protein